MTSIKDARRMGVTLVGVMLLFTAIFGATYALSHQLHQDHAGNVLLASQKANALRVRQQVHGAACTVSDVKEGQLGGILSIPAIHLQAPVEEGTEDQELNVAVGHAPASVWPGLAGTSVFLAHDVSYFVHLNALKPGDVITYSTACNTWKYQVSDQQVVAAGSSVPNTTDATMVLDTCWPPNALFFTSQRLLIHATEVGTAAKGGSLDPGKEFADTVQSTNYTTSAPPPLQAQGLSLDQNYRADGDDEPRQRLGELRPVAGTALPRGCGPRDLLRGPPCGGPAEPRVLGRPGARSGDAPAARRGLGQRPPLAPRRRDRLGQRSPKSGGAARDRAPLGRA